MATCNQDQKFVGVTFVFFDGSTPPRPATIDDSDTPPRVVSADDTIATAVNVAISADKKSVTCDVISGLVGDVILTCIADANMATGTEEDIQVPTETVTVTPGPAGQALTGSATFPAPVAK